MILVYSKVSSLLNLQSIFYIRPMLNNLIIISNVILLALEYNSNSTNLKAEDLKLVSYQYLP